MPQVQGALTGASTNHCHKGPDQFTVTKILNNKKFIVFSIQHIFHNNLHI
jgi:peroxiredoxin